MASKTCLLLKASTLMWPTTYCLTHIYYCLHIEATFLLVQIYLTWSMFSKASCYAIQLFLLIVKHHVCSLLYPLYQQKCYILQSNPSGAGRNPNSSLQKQYFSKGLLSVNKYLLFFLGLLVESYLALSMFPYMSPLIGRGRLSHQIDR